MHKWNGKRVIIHITFLYTGMPDAAHGVFFKFFGKMPEVAEKVKTAPTLVRERRFQGPGGSQNDPLGPPRFLKMVPRFTKNEKRAKLPREKTGEIASEKKAIKKTQKCKMLSLSSYHCF